MKATVIGATGLVGHYIVEELLKNSQVDEVLVLARRPLLISHPKLHTKIVSFDDPNWAGNISGDVLFSALGTTLKAAGSKEAQYKVDHDYQLIAAESASLNKVKSYVLISSVNSDPHSRFFYLKMKGELEEKVSLLPFSSISILRPGPLKGERKVPRLNEKISVKALELLPRFMVSLRALPIEGKNVAVKAVMFGLQMQKGVRIIEAEELHKA